MGMCSPAVYREVFWPGNCQVGEHFGDHLFVHVHSPGVDPWRDVLEIPGLAGMELTMEFNGPPILDTGPVLREIVRQAEPQRGDYLLVYFSNGHVHFTSRVEDALRALDVPVVYAVKEGPILNDATREDALVAGVDRVAMVVSTGSDAPGTILDRCSEEFRRLYEKAGLIIAKGQANYETLSEEGPRVFCMLQTKCPVIARDVGVPVGSIVLRQGRE